MNLPQLTATRFFAAFGIVIYHFGVLVPSVAPFDIPWVHDLFSYSCLGVSYFFVLSGFIMAVVYYQPTRTLDRRRYWVARFARIYPLYALGLVLALIYPLLPLGESFQALTHTGSARASLRMVYEHITSHDPTAVALNFSLLQAWVHGYSMTINPPGWSLSIEALFYLSFPLVLHVAYRLGIRALVAVALGIWVFSLVFQMALIRPGDYWLQFPLMNFNVFIFGFTTGVLFLKTARRGAAQRGAAQRGAAQRGAAQRGAARQELADARRWQWALGALALSCIGLVVLVPGLQAYLGAFMNPVFASIIWWCARSRSWVVTRLLTWRPLVVLGEASYGVYILQVPVFLYLAGAFDFLSLPADPTLRFYISALVLVLVSTACFYWIETPCRNFINHRIGHRARRLTVAKTHTAKSRRQVVR